VPLLGSQFRGFGIKSRILNPYDAFWDQKLGVNTIGFYPPRGQEGDLDWQTHYVPTTYYDLFRLYRMVDLGENDIFVDLGSGLGRPVFAASWHGVKRAIGVEVVSDLCAAATENLARSRLAGRNIQFVCANAMDCQLADTTVLFMFHPFGEHTLRTVLKNLEIARRHASSSPLRIIYGNPIYDFVMSESGWLECIARVPPPRLRFSTASRYVTSLWRSLPGH
jgi:predicted RNA methylase